MECHRRLISCKRKHEVEVGWVVVYGIWYGMGFQMGGHRGSGSGADNLRLVSPYCVALDLLYLYLCLCLGSRTGLARPFVTAARP